MELAGPLKTLVWPELCAHCGGAATHRLKVQKVFDREWYLRRRSVDDVRILVYRSVDVPFCAACVALHRQLVPAIGTMRRITSYFRSVYVVPVAVAVFAVVLYFFRSPMGIPEIVAGPRGPIQAAIFAAIAAAFAMLVAHQTRRWRLPHQTNVTSSFDFSDNLGGLFGTERHVYAMANNAFAAAFTAANAARVWVRGNR